jgi:hypothetical protein
MNFLTGDLHHRGGILFSVISLSILLTFVGGLWKYEQRGSSQARINKKAALVTG